MAVPTGSLTTLTTVKSELNISSSTDDTYLERLIGAATAYAESICNRTFYYSAAITESVAGYGTAYLQLSRAPLSSITSITFDGQTVSSDNYEIYGDGKAGLVYSPTLWINTAMSGPGITKNSYPGSERKLYSVVYKGGYVTPTQDGTGSPVLTRDLPYDLEDAVIQLVVWRYRNRGRDQSVMSESLLNASVSYKQPFATADTLKTLLPQVYDTLKAYSWSSIL
jgi:hypothetical protein